ncbi:hypothetical protein HanRHA438_Chr04g0165931 [Helianthus annuus]|uniref:Arabidopsis retrotransposon Orf1 C-terminal domain-containing protein n=2 Tax=Helianthus annuus TaxID=4232 RepID=A0A9K3J621_HELAN|nr:uncharacterized protein LOC110936686 [Helianthus annuus]KAF5809325.1 hypothetical protein HanXRQr2_Chr04g0155811 [Helianthus annuus]KAJ0580335.1 hypothetical protein HanHA300_Chr04g0128051 [Helianthus annuus]KAJ0596280.1 hypothetical protein HanHA89_Chr04g0140981 [Helianthus annuus]KAJ0925990.1 hypothetical protein HanRHA438_Chr04g0165931 [Helianthus annuus]KAJ0930482.1 hypothetical protein HanPSC8_Chr04g0149821 [Helianthus annuus]
MAGPENHAFLQFEENSPALARLATIRHKALEPARTISWTTLQTLGVKERAKTFLPSAWQRLFAIQQPQYRELVLEFCSTYEFALSCHDLFDDQAIRFRLGGHDHHLSVAQLGLRMGIYTEAEVQRRCFRRALKQIPNDTATAFWHEIGEGPYNPTVTKATHLRDPFHRYFHRVLAHTIAGRGEGTAVCTLKDLFFLYCLVHTRSDVTWLMR